MKTSVLLASALSLVATAPTNTALTAEDIKAIEPVTESCAGRGGDFTKECRTAAQAAGPISHSFSKYRINSVGEQAALVALMLFESGSFTYDKNHFPAPGRPGQGTRNMQSPEFNFEYAKDLYGEETALAANATGPEAVLKLVNGNDADSFGSAAWFLSTQCKDPIKQGLASESQAGWSAYLTECIGTTDVPERDTIWTKTLEILKPDGCA
ncbi:hypothetical protein CC78DRAFT_528302 [Lojkania enalia]|uniref:Uncharacterized protein n=1 Tax=Lojkania enalia TaxID=147567 RepID=A0A9P4TRF6_9PLEO|nr:hypothetical protein CC78DRAFT_528302 [Didymosphaeria enalia]